MRGLVFVVLVASLSACGGGASTNKANPCATKNATYLESFQEVSGDCGPIPSQVINIGSDGTTSGSEPIHCASITQTGCTARDTDCTSSSGSYSYSTTFETTFSSDGSSATGVATLTESGNGQSCSETYNIYFARQ